MQRIFKLSIFLFKGQMVRLKNVLVLALCLIILYSCESNDNVGSVSKDYMVIATVMPTKNDSYYLVLDDGSTLKDVGGYPYNALYRQRAILYFNTLPDNKKGEFDKYVRIHNISNVLTKEIVDLNSGSNISLGSDPIKILLCWIGDDYLNIRFNIKRGGEQTHSLEMIFDSTTIDEQDNKIYLELKHNANGDPALNTAKGYVAFNLRPFIRNDKDSVNLIIKTNDFGIEKSIDLIYYFNKKNIQNSELIDDDNIVCDATLYK